MVGNDASIAKIDAYRLKNVGEMLVTANAPDYADEPDTVLIDLQKLDGKTLLAEYEARLAVFSTTPFDPVGDRLRLFPGGVTIWSGYPGMGKTTILRQFICHLLQKSEGVFLASLEEHPQSALVRLASTASGAEKPNAHQMQWFIDAFGERLRVWGMIGIAQHRKLLAIVRKLADQGIKHAVIDSLMCLDITNDDFEAQRKFANLLAATARASNIHIHLVAHPRKAVSAGQEPDLNDVAGAREIGGIADNVIFVKRNDINGPLADKTGMKICIRKQRHGSGSLGDIDGWFYRSWRQFHVDQFKYTATRYLPEDAYR